MSFNFGTGRSTLPNLPNNTPSNSMFSIGQQYGTSGNLSNQGIFTPNTAFSQQPTRPSLRDVLGGARNIVQDNSRFGDLIAGASILGGTSPADALTLREVLNPTTDDFTVGTLYDVFDNRTGTVIGQVSSKDRAEYERIAADPNLSIRELSPATETGKTPEGTIKRVADDGTISYEPIRGYKENETLEEIRRTNTHVSVVAKQTRNLEEAYKNVIKYAEQQPNGNARLFVLAGGLDQAGSIEESLRAAFTSDAGTLARGSFQFIKSANFINAIAAMRASNKTGGGVGSVTENEMKVLSASAALLTPASADFINQLQRNLEEIGTQREKVNAVAAQDIKLLRRKLSKATEDELYPPQENQEG